MPFLVVACEYFQRRLCRRAVDVSASKSFLVLPRYPDPLPSSSDSVSVSLFTGKVRTSALNIILHVFSVDDPGVRAFLAREENHDVFFTELARLVQDAYSQVLCRVSGTPERCRSPSEDACCDLSWSCDLCDLRR